MADAHGDVRSAGDTVDALRLFSKSCDPVSGGTKAANSDPYRYKMDYPSLGTCLIINNKNFDKSTHMSPRNGTDVDAATAMKTFTDLGYDIRFHNDLTVDQMKEQMLNSNRKYSFSLVPARHCDCVHIQHLI
ncbi:caspase-3-like [Morone saxatilis]|uniref:caspase-3-like n=1 Tax=Morone saxatilis TaxID=34816 RepID=UPI0015E1C929|nr:caspase-3-like [Morone saxatilis]